MVKSDEDSDNPPPNSGPTPPNTLQGSGGSCTLGQYGQIRGLLSEIGRRRDHLDLKFICDNGRMSAHQFMLGAQSAFLRQIMTEDTPRRGHSEVTLILPGVKLHIMKVVLKFLYTGRLYLTQEDVPQVKELLENVLKIDAQITLPEDAESGEGRLGSGDHSGTGGSSGSLGGPSSSSSGLSENRKRSSPTDEKGSSSSANSKDGRGKGCEEPGPAPLEHYSAPLSPPDSRTASPVPVIDLVEETLERRRSPSPKVKKVATARKSSGRQNLSALNKEVHIPTAPVIVTKSTGRRRKLKATSIPTAPLVVAKKSRPSSSSNHARATVSLPPTQDDMPVEVEVIDDDDDDQDDNPVIVSGPSNSRLEPTWSGQTRISGDELPDIPPGPSNPIPIPPLNGPNGLPFDLSRLPPPIPIPPENGLVIHRGNWVPRAHVERLAQKKKAAKSVRKYVYKPFVTISGQSKESTVTASALDTVGTFPCPFMCGAIFERERSLDAHMRRNHHPNLKVSCPECGKGLSTSHSLKKHLLSHRPQSDWPYFCPLCFKKFQAKGDLPKHFLTQRHRDEVPPVGSPEWIALINQGVCVPQMTDLRATKSTRRPKPGLVSGSDGMSGEIVVPL